MLCFGETLRYYSASESSPTSTGMRTPNSSIRLETLSIFFQIGNWCCCIPFDDFEATLLLDVCKLFLGFVQIEIEIIIVSLEELRSKYTVENDNLQSYCAGPLLRKTCQLTCLSLQLQ